MILREYNLNCGLKEIFKKYEWWEILGLMYASEDWLKQQNEAYVEARRRQAEKEKIKSGKMNMIFRPKKKR